MRDEASRTATLHSMRRCDVRRCAERVEEWGDALYTACLLFGGGARGAPGHAIAAAEHMLHRCLAESCRAATGADACIALWAVLRPHGTGHEPMTATAFDRVETEFAARVHAGLSRRVLATCLHDVDALSRACFLARTVLRCSLADIALAAGCSEATVRSACAHAYTHAFSARR